MTKLEQALNAIDPAQVSYNDWLRVGMALKAEGMSPEVWDTWSQRDPARYHPGECQHKWLSFKPREDGISGGSIVYLAKAQGWTPQQELTTPAMQLRTYLNALFQDDETVNIVTQAAPRGDKWSPYGTGMNMNVAELTENLDYAMDHFDGELEGALSGAQLLMQAGAWVRINPMDGQGASDANVTAFRWALVECDELPIDQQVRIIKQLKLPIGALVHSGGRSVHAIVRIDAKDADEYRQRVDELYKYCTRNGLPVDLNNRNPSRLSRLPGAVRGEHMQRLLFVAQETPNWQDWHDMAFPGKLPRLNLFSATELAESDEPPLTWAVNGLVPEGLTVLAGSPKCGKSWMALSMAHAVANGRLFLGRDTTPGDVLYLAFEDSRRRLKERCQKLNLMPSARLSYNTELVTMEMGLMEQIDQWARSVPNPRLVIIDTWGKVRPAAGRDVFAGDYGSFGAVKQAADRRHMAILVVHHLRKASLADGDDPFEKIAGSNGIAAASDQIILLERSRDSDTGRLRWTGREAPEGDVAVRLMEGLWKVVSGEDAAREAFEHNEVAQAVRALMAQEGITERAVKYADFVVDAQKSGYYSIGPSAKDASKQLRNVAPLLQRFAGIEVIDDIKVGSQRGFRIRQMTTHRREPAAEQTMFSQE